MLTKLTLVVFLLSKAPVVVKYLAILLLGFSVEQHRRVLKDRKEELVTGESSDGVWAVGSKTTSPVLVFLSIVCSVLFFCIDLVYETNPVLMAAIYGLTVFLIVRDILRINKMHILVFGKRKLRCLTHGRNIGEIGYEDIDRVAMFDDGEGLFWIEVILDEDAPTKRWPEVGDIAEAAIRPHNHPSLTCIVPCNQYHVDRDVLLKQILRRALQARSEASPRPG